MRRVVAGLRALLWRRQAEREIDEELQAYLEATADQLISRGMRREDALRAARLSVGNLEAAKEAVRDVGWESRVEGLLRDVRDAWRALRRSPGFTAVAVLTLALGIGVNTALFSIVNSLLLRALPVAAPERLAMVSTQSAMDGGFPSGWTYRMWEEMRKQPDAFAGAVAWSVIPQRFDLAQGGESELVDGLFVSWNFFDELGVAPFAGRSFVPEEDALGRPESRVAVISHGFWQRRYGGAGDVVGSGLLVNRVPVTIAGVAPPEFAGPEVGRAFDIALPIGSAPLVLHDDTWGAPTGFSYLAVMLRLRPEQTLDESTRRLRGLHREMIEASLGPNEVWGPNQQAQLDDPIVLSPAAAGTSELRRRYSQSLVAVMAIATLVLLIACANIASLLHARHAARQREIGTRIALGATRWRIVQHLLVESLLLSTAGAAVGLLFAVWGSRALVAQLSTWFERVVLDVSLDWRVMSYTAAAAIVTAVVFGAGPAVRSSRIAPAAIAQRGASLVRLGGHGGLVAVQVALSLVLLVSAGLFIRTFERLTAAPLGFDAEQVMVVRVDARRATLDAVQRPEFYQRLVDTVARIPGVTRAAASMNTPVNRGVTLVGDFVVSSGPAIPRRDQRVIVNYVTPGWFETYGVPVRDGRVVGRNDTVGTMPVAVANEAFARRFLPERRTVGSYVTDTLPVPERRDVPKLVVGVVGDSVDQSLRGEPYPTLYLPLAQLMQHPFAGSSFMTPFEVSLSVRAGIPPAQLSRDIAATLTSVDPRLAFSIQLLEDQVAAARHQERLVAWLSALFGTLALSLTAIGLFGVTSYGAKRRRTEIGVRMALGARRRDVIGLAVRHTIVMTLVGLASGLIVAALLTRYLQALLFGVTPLDPITFLAAPVLLLTVAMLASYLPARQAATIDPMNVLRLE